MNAHKDAELLRDYHKIVKINKRRKLWDDVVGVLALLGIFSTVLLLTT